MRTSLRVSSSALVSGFSAIVMLAGQTIAGGQTNAADGPWSGEAVCVMSSRGKDYQEDQTHRWRLTGERPNPKGAVKFWPAVWSVQGGGTKGEERWTIDVPETPAPLAIYEIPGPNGNNSLRIESQHAQLKAAQGIRLAPRAGLKRLSEFSLWELSFPKLTADSAATVTVISDSSTGKGTRTYAWQPPSDVESTQTCKWRFVRGEATTPVSSAISQGSLQSTSSAATAATSSNAQPTLSAAGGAKPQIQQVVPPASTAADVGRPTAGGARLASPSVLPDPQTWDVAWSQPQVTRTLSGQRLTDGSGALPIVRVNGIQATVVSATPTAIRFVVPFMAPGFTGGPVPVAVETSAGSAAASTPLIIIGGAPVITSLSTLFISAGTANITLTVRGNNLAMADGICLPAAPRFAPRTAPATSNDRMDVHLQFPRIQTGPVLPANMIGGTLTCWTSNNPVSIQIK